MSFVADSETEMSFVADSETEMMTVADFLARGLRATLDSSLASKVVSVNTFCAITGERITSGLRWQDVIPGTTSEYLDLLHGATSQYISVSAAIAFKAAVNLGSRMIFEDCTMYHPLITRADGRECWSDLVRTVWPARAGQRCVAIVAVDPKKRVWPRAAVGALGTATPVYVYDPANNVSRNIVVSWPKLLETLSLIEEVYNLGYSKRAIADGLFNNYAAFSSDPRRALDYERDLQNVRRTPEFVVALTIAAKKEEK